MKIKAVTCLLFFLNTLLFATYYSVSKEALGRIEPIVFSFFEMVVLAPVALCILALTWKDVTSTVIKRGVLLGSMLCLALFTIAIALKYTTATDTAFFPSLNGLLAALIAWLLLKQPVKKVTWFAGVISVIGTVLLISYSPMGGWRGTVIAFLGGVFFTCYVFLADHEQQDDVPPWPLFGVEMLTTAAWATLIALLFGDWQAVHPLFPKDTLIILYVAGATTFLPILITVLMQKYISPVTVSFIYILEPVSGAIIANLYLHEILPLQGYIGGGLVIVGTLIHTWGVSRRSAHQRPATVQTVREPFPQADRKGRPSILPGRTASPASRRSFVPSSPLEIFAFAALLGIEAFLLYHFSSFPPPEWLKLYQLLPSLLYIVQQGQGMLVLMLCIRAFGWLLVWATLITLGFLTVYGGLASMFSRSKQSSGRNSLRPYGSVQLSQTRVRQLPQPAQSPQYRQFVQTPPTVPLSKRVPLREGHQSL
jgi:drug/metabolite transporter (DMT)-like permease